MSDLTLTPDAKGSWRVAAAGLALTVGILLLAVAAGLAAANLFDLWASVDEPRAFRAGEPEALSTMRLACFFVAFQGVATFLAFVAAQHIDVRSERLLRFNVPQRPWVSAFAAVAVLLTIALVYGGLIWRLDRASFSNDIGMFSEMARSDVWWMLLLTAGIGAPIAEEILFRGLLFGTLRQSRAGASGAAVISAFLWAALHANYSFYGLIAIGLIGIYLAYLRERTGSLFLPIVCHGAYNTLVVLLLAFTPQYYFAA